MVNRPRPQGERVGLSAICRRNLAEGKGFEPLETCASLVFKTSAFDRSAIPPSSLLALATSAGGDTLQPTALNVQYVLPLGEVLEWLNRAAC